MADRVHAPWRPLAVGGLAVAAAMTLAACGSSDDVASDQDPASPSAAVSSPSTPDTPSPTASSTTPGDSQHRDAPACSSVWKTGATLPGKYAGCNDADGAFVAVQQFECESGQRLVRYDNHYWAMRNGIVKHAKGPLVADKHYYRDFSTCRA